MVSLLLADATGLSTEGDCTDTSMLADGRLFDYFVCRVAGLPVRYMEELRAERTIEIFEELLRTEDQMATARDGVVDRLHAVVGDIDDRKLRGKVLRIKRDVHNLRRLREAHLLTVAEALALDLVADLQDYSDLEVRRQGLQADFEASYEVEVLACRQRFQSSIGDDDFQKGLLLSSQDLFASLSRYSKSPVERQGAKQRQIERGLMRYFSRMVMKTSPFGTFTSIVEGRFTDGVGSGLDFVGDPRRKQSLVRLNKSIYGVLQRELLTNATVRDALPVELNPSLRRLGAQWQFLSAKGVGETFQRVPRNPVLELFMQLIEADGPQPLAALRQHVADQVDASSEQLHRFTERLLDIGFLRFRFGIGEQEVEWDRPLRNLLAPIDDPEATSVVGLLDALRTGSERYGEADVAGRRHLLAEATTRISDSYDSLRERRALRTDVPFYEDAGAASRLDVSAKEMVGLEETLVEYIRLTSKLAWPRHEHISMRHFFDTYYGTSSGDSFAGDVAGADKPSVPLLQFYEDYYREHLKDHLRKEKLTVRGLPIEDVAAVQVPDEGDAADPDGSDQDVSGQDASAQGDGESSTFDELNPFKLEQVEHIREANDGLTRLLRERWRQFPDAEEIVLERHELEDAVADIPAAVHPGLSVSIFVQLLPGLARDGGPALLMSNYLKGFGKYFSRFLDVLPGHVQAAIVDNNRQLSDAYLAEICGDGNFNANLHPPLVDHEVSYPTAESGGAEGQLATSDLFVEPASGDAHALALRHGPSGQQVVPLDLGFQNPKMRPPLYQLLSSFAPACNFFLQVPDLMRSWDEASEEEQESNDFVPAVAYRPRIVFDGRLVAARRRWAIRADVFPRRDARESESEFFQRANRWRREHGIPQEVFLSVRVLPMPKNQEKVTDHEGAEAAIVDGENEKRKTSRQKPASRDRVHKPQYIDFENPLLVDLLGRATENQQAFQAFFYERLPGRQHLARHGEDRYVTEMVIQVDTPETADVTRLDPTTSSRTGGRS